ncbi:hypothetical protein JAAARDRAFT_199786 [Jaapia argillacea MUCL 33604]|uniref:Retrotransposon gag domain-containing protein n=1 Tax=Jaapia argillacea MUCL 33604 TaxID=933084 RepID=A0A067PA02_9AGAM|nr:hypothetical protein JAAARDRAFT_199786 [Jaapia argillacea MUCL 33604]
MELQSKRYNGAIPLVGGLGSPQRSGDDTDDDQLVMPSGDQGAVFPAQQEGMSFGEHPLNILGPELFGRGPSPRISMLVDPRIPSVGATGSRHPSMVASSKHLSSWSTDRWVKVDQDLAVFMDEIAGALVQVTKLNRALQVKLDATEFVLSGQNNVSSVFSYATGSGSGYAVIPSPAPSIESLLAGPVSRVPSKDSSASPCSFLIDRASGRAEGTVWVPETPFPGPDTTDANIMASVSRLGDDHRSGGNGGRGGAPPAPPPPPGSSNSSADSSHHCFNSDDCDSRRPLPSNHGSNDGNSNRSGPPPTKDRSGGGAPGGLGTGPPGGSRRPPSGGGGPPDGGGPPVPPQNDDDDSSHNDDQPCGGPSYSPSNVRFDLGNDLMSSASRRLRPNRMSHAYSSTPHTYLNPTAIVDHPDGYEEESLTRIRPSQPLPKGVKTPAPYHWKGEDDVEKFENWFQVDFLGQFLRKQALSWFNYEIDTPNYYNRDLNFERVVCALHTRFLHKATAQEAVHKFLGCKFSSETGVAMYYNALRHNAGRMVVAPNDYTFHREFLAGIPEEIRDLLMKNRGVNAEFMSSEAMYREAIEMETSLKFMARQRQLNGARQGEETEPMTIKGIHEITLLDENAVIMTREAETTDLCLTTSLKATVHLNRMTSDVRELITKGMTDLWVTTGMVMEEGLPGLPKLMNPGLIK